MPGFSLPDILRYMYGLEPTEDDPSVDLRIEIEDGVPVLLHGLNESADDYEFTYQQKAALTDPWTWASEDDATAIDVVVIDERTHLKIILPLEPKGRFVRLAIMPQTD